MIKVGDKIPQLILKIAGKNFIKDFDLHSNFINKKILLICVPGAFTSTCHNKHLPPYIVNAGFLKREKNIDSICCISINDPYVMQQWKISLKTDELLFLSDGNSDFGNKMDLVKPFNHNLMGSRLKRSIIIIENLTLKQMITDESGFEKTSYEELLKVI